MLSPTCSQTLTSLPHINLSVDRTLDKVYDPHMNKVSRNPVCWYTSDLHFGHTNILKYAPQRFDYLGLRNKRPVSEMTDEEVRSWVTEMNEGLVRLWNSQVTADDTVWVIGDMCMGKVHETIQYVGRLNGTKILVWGNHDRPHPGATKNPDKRAEWERVYGEVFDRQILDTDHEIDGIYVKINHFPFDGLDHTSEERYNSDMIAQYSPCDTGVPLVHGHVHDLYQTRDHMYNVGIDAWAGEFRTEKQIGDHFRSIGF